MSLQGAVYLRSVTAYLGPFCLFGFVLTRFIKQIRVRLLFSNHLFVFFACCILHATVYKSVNSECIIFRYILKSLWDSHLQTLLICIWHWLCDLVTANSVNSFCFHKRVLSAHLLFDTELNCTGTGVPFVHCTPTPFWLQTFLRDWLLYQHD